MGGFWKGGKHWSEVLADDGISYLKQAQQSDKPFFMYLAFNAPHDPRQAPKKYVDMYPLEDIKVPENFLPEYPYKEYAGAGKKLRDEQLAPFPRTEYSVKKGLQEYYAIVSHMDAQIGRILEALEASGMADNTYVIFAADHGLAMGDHGFMGKQNMYENSMRVPLMMAGPGIETGKFVDAQVYLQDLMATSIELAGLEKPSQVEFSSLMPLATGKTKQSVYDAIYGCYFSNQRMILTDQHKMIIYPAANIVRLYDVVNDPLEMQDLAVNKTGNAELLNSLLLQFQKLQRDMNDPVDVTAAFKQFHEQCTPTAAYLKASKLCHALITSLKQHLCARKLKASTLRCDDMPNPSYWITNDFEANHRPIPDLDFFRLFAQQQPNIVYIMCDDLGYGDIACLNPEYGKIPTPSVDMLASQGMKFTDAHSGSSVCTPTRYGLLTGRYSWRTQLQRGVCQGFAPCFIAEDRPTVASFLKSQGYATAIIGKWHLNCLFLDAKTGTPLDANKYKRTAPVGAKIPDGPFHRGFDFFHGIHHAGSMKAIIENDKVIQHDKEINFLPRCEKQCVQYVDSRKGNDQPFFLFVPLGSPHSPILPTAEWQGKSGLGKYGDFVMQTDHAVGEILKSLDRNGFAENTLVVFTSDNGCSKGAGIPQLAKKGHKVSANLRGSKADIWDGGHRVPFIVRWPGKIEPGTNSDQLICHTDLFSTVGDILNTPVPSKSCEDSVSILPSFTGETIESSRAGVIHHSISGHFAIRKGKWKLALAKASGGWSSPKEAQAGPDAPKAQLYDMTADIGERQNLYLENPTVADELLQQLTAYVYNGRSTDGPESPNDVAPEVIKLWKSDGLVVEKKQKKKRSPKK